MLGLLGQFGQTMQPLGTALSGMHQPIADNRMALMGLGAGLMSGPMSTAMPDAMKQMMYGALVDEKSRAAKMAELEKARAYQSQVQIAKSLGLDPVFADSPSVLNAVAADRFKSKTPREQSFTERQFNMLTPEEQAAYRKREFLGEGKESPTAGWKPVTVNGETLFTNKDGTEFKRPEDLGIGARPGGGTGPAPTAEMRNKAAAAQKVQENIGGALEEHEKLVATYKDQGKSLLPSEGKTRLAVSHRNLQMLMKEAYDLGAITGPDLGILQSMIPDPVVSATDPTSYGNFYDIEARTKAAKEELKKIVARNAASAQGTVGGPAPAPTDPFAGVTIRQVR